jgi:hypothetical protein
MSFIAFETVLIVDRMPFRNVSEFVDYRLQEPATKSYSASKIQPTSLTKLKDVIVDNKQHLMTMNVSQLLSQMTKVSML